MANRDKMPDAESALLAPVLKSVKSGNTSESPADGVVIIGMGRWGRILRSELSRRPNAPDIFCVARSNYEELLAEGGYSRENLFPSSPETLDALLSAPAIGAVVIASSYSSHYENALRALNAGKNVMIEKPAVETHAQLIEILEFANMRGLILTVGYEYLFDPNIGQLGRELSAGLAGKISSVEISLLSPSGHFDPSANVIEDVCSHPLSMLHLLFGAADFEVGRCRLRGEEGDIELVYGGIDVRINLSRCAKERVRTIVVNGSKLDLNLDYASGALSLTGPDGAAVAKDDPRFPSAFAQGPVSGPGTLAAEFDEFMGAVRYGVTPRNSVEHVSWITRCLEEIYGRLENVTAAPDGDIAAAS